MKIRQRALPTGWYPAGEAETRRRIARMEAELPAVEAKPDAVAGIVPHAGWDFSGVIALDVLRRFGSDVDTIVVVGGHLSVKGGILAASEEGFDTPLGVIESDRDFLDAVKAGLPVQEDNRPDNTVEIQLPLIRYFFPRSRVVCLRAAPSEISLRLGTVLYESGRRLSRRLYVIGSTDLTHYGSAYGFSPHGTGANAVHWVKEVNDKRFIDAVLAMNGTATLDLAERDSSACSAGGAAAAAAFASAAGVKAGELVSYRTSWDIMPSSSFVGYAGVLFRRL